MQPDHDSLWRYPVTISQKLSGVRGLWEADRGKLLI